MDSSPFLAPAFMLLGALGATGLANNHARKLARAREAREDRAELRPMVIEFLRGGRAWTPLAETSLPQAARQRRPSRGKQRRSSVVLVPRATRGVR